MKTLVLLALLLFAIFGEAATIDLRALAAQAASNLSARVSGAIAASTNAVRVLASPSNYALLKSTKLADAAKKLALQKQLAEAAILDEEQTEAGRLKWHGPYVSQILNMTNLTATLVHEDGTTYTVAFSTPNLLALIAAANARLPQPPMTNGVPRALAEARTRRYQEELESPVNLTVEVNANRGTRPE